MNNLVILINGLGTPEIIVLLFVCIGIPVAVFYGIYRAVYYKAHYDASKNKEETDVMYCSKCGDKNSKSNSFCSKCGNKLN